MDKETFADRQAFAAQIPADALQADQYLEFFYYGPDGVERRMAILATAYQARLHSELSQCWWSFRTDDEKKPCSYMVTWDAGKKRPGGRNVTENEKNGGRAHEAGVTKTDGVCGKGERRLPFAWRPYGAGASVFERNTLRKERFQKDVSDAVQLLAFLSVL